MTDHFLQATEIVAQMEIVVKFTYQKKRSDKDHEFNSTRD